jgi:hypothetical protein
MPTVCFTGRLVRSDASAVVEGAVVDVELRRVGAHPREGDSRRLLHHVAELAGQDERLLAFHGRGLDEQDVAAGASHG